MAAAIWDRAGATIEVSREHSDYFVKNMVAILCEERLALSVFRPKALIYGGFPFGS
jgi:HK97 family phage major capsid protein